MLLLCSFSVQAGAATVLVFGDSISAAYGLEVEQGWVHLLQQRLEARFPGRHRVVNGSVSGETTDGGRARLPALLAQQHPALVIIELGGNDGLRGQSPQVMAGNLEAMARMARKQGAAVVMLGMRIPPNYGHAYTQAFEQAFVTASRKAGVPLLPFFLDGIGGRPELMQDDGLHPNAAAQGRLLDNAWPLIVRALAKARQ
jgi:acyl-CoA thioesterase-1